MCCNYEETSNTFVIFWKTHPCNIAHHLQSCGALPFCIEEEGWRARNGCVVNRLFEWTSLNTKCIYSGVAETNYWNPQQTADFWAD